MPLTGAAIRAAKAKEGRTIKLSDGGRPSITKLRAAERSQILTHAAKPSNSTASRCAVWCFETLERASPAKDAPVVPPSYLFM